MEAVHNTRAARAAQAISDASAKFHFYQNLSTEIKLMIWDIIHANRWASGAHRFRLTLNPEDPTRLFVQPDKPQKHDASAWRERYALARIDKYSFDSWLRLERHTTLFCTETQRGRRARAERNEISARVGKGDLTTFLYNYGATQASLALLSPSANREVFAGITQIGVETGYMFRRSSRNSKYSPFSCGCDDDRHYWRPCLIGFIQFIRFFKDLQAFYLIGSFPPVYVESTLEYSGLHKSSEIRCKLDAYRYIKGESFDFPQCYACR
ncbi:hypothetical protein F5Y10DRAFT_235230 [Nemania abortiva]|nr:hypothetical protein F5Y10DRAFT_235230 [Nemania abortiva]